MRNLFVLLAVATFGLAACGQKDTNTNQQNLAMAGEVTASTPAQDVQPAAAVIPAADIVKAEGKQLQPQVPVQPSAVAEAAKATVDVAVPTTETATPSEEKTPATETIAPTTEETTESPEVETVTTPENTDTKEALTAQDAQPAAPVVEDQTQTETTQ